MAVVGEEGDDVTTRSSDDVVEIITKSLTNFFNPPSTHPTSPHHSTHPPPTARSKPIPPRAGIHTPSTLSTPTSPITPHRDKGKGKAKMDVPPPLSLDEGFKFGNTIGLDSSMHELNLSRLDSHLTGLTTNSHPTSAFDPSSMDDAHRFKGKLLFCKSQVYIHPSKRSKDNIPGYLGLAKVPIGEYPTNAGMESRIQSRRGSAHDTEALVAGKEKEKDKAEEKDTVVLFWVPVSVAEGLNEDGTYEKVSEKAEKIVKGQQASAQKEGVGEKDKGKGKGVEKEVGIEDDYVMITLPPTTSTGHIPPSNPHHSTFSPSPSQSSRSSLRSPSVSTFNYPTLNPSNNDNSHTDASSLLLVSEGGDLLQSELEGGEERAESANKMILERRRREGEYAWCVSLGEIYSILVYAPSWGQWYGSVTLNLLGGISLPSLYFHDDESPSTLEMIKASRAASATTANIEADVQTPIPSSPRPGSGVNVDAAAKPISGKVPWGATPFFAALREHAEVLRSRLEPRLFLVNPSRTDREVHEIDLGSSTENDRILPKAAARPRGSSTSTVGSVEIKPAAQAGNYPPKAGFPVTADIPAAPSFHPTRTQLLSGFSQLTQKAKRLTQDILSQSFAEPIVPHLPQPIKELVQAPHEWEARAKKTDGQKTGNVAGEFESARVYLARWARVVAEEGEKSRKAELAAKARLERKYGETEAKSDLGIFEIVRTARAGGEQPSTTRVTGSPVKLAEIEDWREKGLGEAILRKEVFRRGVEAGEARKLVWEVFLGVVGWEVGLGKSPAGSKSLREAIRADKRKEYDSLKEKWQKREVHGDEKEREEWHRIDVDCRRTDRNQPLFAVPDTMKGEEEKEGGGAGKDVSPTASVFGEAEEGSQTALNPHVAALRTILMTYHIYSPNLGYVQGMSDLLSPIYVVHDADESESFWAFCGWMKVMEVNFLRDQSGMKHKLTTLQQLINVMDPQLYRKLERTNSTSLFMCFRWLLIDFKREFKFDEVIRLWDVLFTNYYSDSFVLFVALAVLHSHREVILRYLVEFDEVLKYANNLSESIDLESTLAQAEVLFLSFRSLVEEVDRNELVRSGVARMREEQENSHNTGNVFMRRRGSVSTNGSEPRKDLVSDDLRELLVGWGSHQPHEPEAEV